MSWSSLPYLLPLVVTALVAVAMAGYAWKRRETPGAVALAVLLLAAGWWAAGYALELGLDGRTTKLFWAKAEYLGIVAVPASWLLFAWSYAGRDSRPRRRRLALLAVEPLVTLGLVWTNGAHELVWRRVDLVDVGPLDALDFTPGAWFWVNVAYSYVLLAIGSAVIISMVLRSPRLYRQQSSALVFGVLAPWLGNLIYVLGISPAPELDLTVFALPIAGCFLLWDLYRFSLLNVGPSMREATLGAAVPGNAVVLLDSRHRIVDLNHAAQLILGRSVSQALGRPLEYVRGDLVAALDPYWGLDEAQIDTRLVAGQDQRDFDLALSVLRDNRGRVGGHLLVMRDSTERRRVEQRLRFLAEAGEVLAGSLEYETTLMQLARLVVPFLADVCIVDILRDGAIEPLAVAHVDPTAEELIHELHRRYPLDLSGRSVVGEVVRTGRPRIFEVLTDEQLVAVARSPEHLELLRALHYRSLMIVPLIAREQTIGSIRLALTSAERHYSPDDLVIAEELASHAALALDNARLYQEAQEAIRAREEFLSIASHEMKTPLTSLKVGTQLLQRVTSGTDVDPTRVRRIAGQLHGEAARLEALVADLLDVSRIRRGAFELHPEAVDLADLTRQACERLGRGPLWTPRHTLALDAPEPVEGTWDPRRLDQILTNLLSNALKYSPQGGTIGVSVRRDGESATLVVRDEGVGVAPEDQVRLFEPFTRGRYAQHHAPGTGLGLYIAAQIVERHGGSIGVQSDVGTGSTFTVRLPLHPDMPPSRDYRT